MRSRTEKCPRHAGYPDIPLRGRKSLGAVAPVAPSTAAPTAHDELRKALEKWHRAELCLQAAFEAHMLLAPQRRQEEEVRFVRLRDSAIDVQAAILASLHPECWAILRKNPTIHLPGVVFLIGWDHEDDCFLSLSSDRCLDL